MGIGVGEILCCSQSANSINSIADSASLVDQRRKRFVFSLLNQEKNSFCQCFGVILGLFQPLDFVVDLSIGPESHGSVHQQSTKNVPSGSGSFMQ